MDAAAIEEHVCINSCHCFPKLKPGEKPNPDEKCPACHEKRYKIVLAGPRRRARLVPRNKFWYFGLAHVVGTLMFGSELWCRHRAAVSSQDFFDFSTSKEWTRLTKALGTTDLSSCVKCEVSFDFGNVYSFCSWSTGIMFLRYTYVTGAVQLSALP